ncbi:MAG TPA: 3-oxo-tetronate kinase [Actinophytocola sp.]|nr:3-oxo-tetronate kinase [Actinophytocola sp.]
MAIKLGCIADDFTGATDLANNLVRAGMRVVQTINTPDLATDTDTDADAVVIALKSRTIPAADAVAQSLEALRWLQAAGAEQIYFKYCSTFDSTPAGNIGPVTEALMAALKTRLTIATPAFPDNGRTVFKGYLFVGDVLLSESGMRHHPLTPMTDSNLVNVLAAQATVPVGLIDHRVVGAGPQAITRRLEELEREGVGIAIVDAVSNDDLLRLGPALAGMPLVTGGSGVAIGLPANWGIEPSAAAAALPVPTGHRAIVSGSVSVATNGQVREFLASGRPAFAIDPLRVADGEDLVAAALAFADEHLAGGPVLVYSTENPEAVKRVQSALGVAEAGGLVERTLAAVSTGLVERGVRQLVVAGGETSGAVVQALGLQTLRIGAQIDPGVPWCAAPLPGGDTLHITLKSGNFGTPDFFLKALDALAQPA